MSLNTSSVSALTLWRGRWARFWEVFPLSRATRVVLLILVGATVAVDLIRATIAGELPNGIPPVIVAVIIAGFAWRPLLAVVLLVGGAIVVIPLGATDVWLLGMAIAAGLVVVSCSVPLAVAYGAVFLVAIVIGESARVDVRPLAFVIVLLVVAAASFLGGALFRSARRRQKALVARLSAEAVAARAAVQEERLRIADELHDFIAHELTIIVMHARVLDRTGDPQTSATARRAIEDAAVQALADIRRVLDATQAHRFTPDPGADDVVDRRHTLTDALTDARRELAGLGGRVNVGDLATDREPLSRTIDAGLAHIVREATTNIVKHGGAGDIDIEVLRSSDDVRLTIENDLDATVSPMQLPRGGYGLARMRERALLSGGTFEVGPRDGRWIVSVTVPSR